MKIPHDYQNNSIGADVCKNCGHFATVPDWPPYCYQFMTKPTQHVNWKESHEFDQDLPTSLLCKCGLPYVSPLHIKPDQEHIKDSLTTELRKEIYDMILKSALDTNYKRGDLEKLADQIHSIVLQKMAREVWKTLDNIRRFDDKENGVNYFSGWDNALDTVEMDFKYLLSKEEVEVER